MEERQFNSQCEFKEGALYEFPEEIEGRSILNLGGDSSAVKFKTALFLYGRERRARGGTILNRDYLFMPSSGRQIAIVSLTFGHGGELPKRIGFFRKTRGWVARIVEMTIAKRQLGGTLRRGQVYEWPSPISVDSLTKSLVRNGTGKMVFGPRRLRFKRGLLLAYVAQSDECLFEVEVLDEDGITVVGQDKVVLKIVKANLPKR